MILFKYFRIMEPQMLSRKKPFRFSAGQDISLLKEVLSVNPHNTQHGREWLQIAEALNEVEMPVDGRRCRDKTALLLDYFRKENQEMLRRYVIYFSDI